MVFLCETAEVETIETDLLLVGGGMACTGAAVEAAAWAKATGLKCTLVDKAALDRSGAVAMGLSAINTYIGPENKVCRLCENGPHRPHGHHP